MTTPRDVVEQRLALVATQDRDAEIRLYAPDAVVEFPFAPTDIPDRFEGRDAILRMSKALDASRGTAIVVDAERVERTVRQTDDPEVVVVEMDIPVEDPSSGAERRLRQIHVYRVRDGVIRSIKDYFGPDTAAFVRQALAT